MERDKVCLAQVQLGDPGHEVMKDEKVLHCLVVFITPDGNCSVVHSLPKDNTSLAVKVEVLGKMLILSFSWASFTQDSTQKKKTKLEVPASVLFRAVKCLNLFLL